VVSTTVGAEGLDVQHGQDIVLSDQPEDFAESVTALLRDVEARGRLGRAAAQLAAKYGWPVIGAKFKAILQNVIGKSSAAKAGHAPGGGDPGNLADVGSADLVKSS